MLGQQFLRFSLIGALGFIVDVSVLYLCRHFDLGLYLARLVSFAAAASFTWLGNRLYTFRSSARRSVRLRAEWIRYLVAMCGGALLNYGTYAALVSLYEMARNHPWLGVVAGTAAGMVLNFFLARRILYRRAA